MKEWLDKLKDYEFFAARHAAVYPGHVELMTDSTERFRLLRFIADSLKAVHILTTAYDPMGDGKHAILDVWASREHKTTILVITPMQQGESLISMAVDYPSMAFYEREMAEMFGLNIFGHPDMRPWVLHENWPENLHPLDKAFPSDFKPEEAHRKIPMRQIEGQGVFEIPVGPVHAGIIEPGHFRFTVAGEPIAHLEAKLGYVHKGIEKLAEGKSPAQAVYLAERISGDETIANSLAFCLAVERISANPVPERASWLRVILAEMERIYNHLGDLQGLCVDTAFVFAGGQFAMMRRWCMVANEEISRSRLLRSSIRPGGIWVDFLSTKRTYLENHIRKLRKEFRETVDIMMAQSMFIDRVEGTGIIAADAAVSLHAVGPAGRSAGMDFDVRRDIPYAAYDRMRFDVPLHHGGDVNCRMKVKTEEVENSFRLILQAMEEAPEGPVWADPGEMRPWCVGVSAVEAPRGEAVHLVVVNTEGKLIRFKPRTPSFCNWPVLAGAVAGNVVPDFPLINKSFNLSYAGNDL